MLTTNTKDQICWQTSGNIAVPHGVFNRSGGISSSPYESLNLSFGVGDKPTSVLHNRKAIKQILNINSLISCHQVHGNRVTVIGRTESDRELADSDALITNQPGTGLLIQQADCQALLLHDPDRQAIAAIHSGWRGSVLNIIGQTINAMQQNFNVNPNNLQAVISPSLGPCCGEFIHYRKELPQEFHTFQVSENYFDFWAISRWQLEQSGVNSKNISTARVCTACDQNFFSYRRAMKEGNGVTGRNGSAIALPMR